MRSRKHTRAESGITPSVVLGNHSSQSVGSTESGEFTRGITMPLRTRKATAPKFKYTVPGNDCAIGRADAIAHLGANGVRRRPSSPSLSTIR